MQEINNPELLTTKELADRTKKSARGWEALRLRGGGPPYIRVDGRKVRYFWADVLDWLEKRRYTSTSEEEVAQ